jgi:hypothetical protein
MLWPFYFPKHNNMLSEKQLEQFRSLHKKRFGTDITKEEAYTSAAALLRLVELTFTPMTEKEYEQVQKRRKETGDI